MKRIMLTATIIGLGPIASVGAQQPTRVEWKIDGVVREALVYAPAAAKSTASPLVFVFHGHGGSMQNAARSFAIHKHWPEAIAVCMQGLNTPGKLTDPEGKRSGWQHSPGDQKDRDLKFFDAVLKSIKADYKVDERRIYSTGHSNGGGFTYLLWATRGDVFAAMAPSSAAAARTLKGLKPKPVLHLAGEKDELVKFDWQRQTIAVLKKLNQCEEAGKEFARSTTIFPSRQGAPVATFIHQGGHAFPAADAVPVIVKFFKENPRKQE